jgi:D-3-phosphoglycerate dehydrogenase
VGSTTKLPTILVLERIHPRGQSLLEARGKVIIPKALDEATLLPLVRDADAIVTRAMARITRRLMEAAPQLKVVGRHGIGVDNIDVEAATDLGVWVVNTPDAPTEPVAEHFLMLALILQKHFGFTKHVLDTGDWSIRMDRPGRELRGRTVGIVGFGRIGRRIAEICCLGFGCQILYADTVDGGERAATLAARRVPLDQLLAESDIVSLNVPLIAETRHMIGKREIELMKPTAYLINLCRGPVWDEAAVYQALKAKCIAGAASDVFETEPAPADHPLLQLDNFVATPHSSSSTEEALERMSLVAEDVIAVLDGQEPRWAVNSVGCARIA